MNSVKNYITVSEYAARLGFTTGRVRQMLIAGQIKGAIKKGRAWLIPINAADAPDA
jgi:excisionase family DNA binding protein